MYCWGKPQFFGVRAAAANIGHGKGTYTAEQFQEDFPQFFKEDGPVSYTHLTLPTNSRV